MPAADVTTNASANTNTDHLRAAVGSTTATYINALYLWGRASAATNISNISAKLLRMSVASTGGSGITPAKRDQNSPAAVAVWSTGPSIGTPVANPDIEIGCLSAGAAYWMPYDPDAAIYLTPAGSGAAGNIDLVSQGSASSLPFRYSVELYER